MPNLHVKHVAKGITKCHLGYNQMSSISKGYKKCHLFINITSVIKLNEDSFVKYAIGNVTILHIYISINKLTIITSIFMSHMQQRI